MPKIGDKVIIEITGAPNIGTALTSGSTEIRIAPDDRTRFSGRVVEDHGQYWLIELDLLLGGKNRILVAKSAQKSALTEA